jgi:hypothetical protein
LHRLYCAYVVHPDAPSRRSTSRQSAALALVVCPVTASRGATTCHPDCTGSTAPMSCIRTHHLAGRLSHRLATLALAMRPVTTSRGATTRRPDCAGSTAPMPCMWTRYVASRLLVGRPHWLSSCVRSLRLAARLLVVRIAPPLLHQCRAPGRAVLTLDFLSISRTGSRRVPGHFVVHRDYPSHSRNGYTSPTPCDRVPRHVTRLVSWLVVDYSASRRSSSTTSPTPRVRVPQHVARLVVPLVVDYFT